MLIYSVRILALVIVALALPNSAVAQISFASVTYTNAQISPAAVAVADLNGDGVDDIAVTDFNGQVVIVIGGVTQASYAVGSFPRAILAAHLNADGFRDLAIANFGSNNISILLGNGNGTFSPAPDVPVGTNPISIAAADFNSDGIMDLAVSNFGSATISIRLGLGGGAFSAGPTLQVGTPWQVAAGDVNGDGRADLVVANPVDNTISALRGNGDGTFQTPMTTAAPTGSRGLALGDFNKDGRLDAATVSPATNEVGVLLGNGNGTFQTAVTYAAGASPNAIVAVDLTGDGILELATANTFSDSVSVLRGLPNGAFSSALSFQTGATPAGIAWGNSNSDGKNDLVTADRDSNSATVLRNTSVIPVSITIQSAPVGRTFSLDAGSSQSAPQTYPFNWQETHTIAWTSPQIAGGSRYTFQGWASGATGNPATLIIPGADAIFTANFAVEHQLTIAISPTGAGSATPLSGTYQSAGSTVTVAATANPGFTFTGWSGAAANPALPTTSVLMDAPKSLTANFAPITEVSVQTMPAGRSYMVDSVTYTAPQVFTWLQGSQHSLATASIQPGTAGIRFLFQNWSDGGGASHTVTAGAAASYTAVFATQYLLTTVVTPAASGAITADPPSADGYYNAGTSVQLSSVPATSYRFRAWDGPFTGSGNPFPLIMPGPVTVGARFEPLPDCQFLLSRRARSVLPSGDLARLDLFTASHCTWTAASNSNWISVLSGASGAGNGTVRYQVEPNPSSTPRSGSVTIAGQPFPVFQSGAGCEFTLAPGSQTGGATQAPFTLRVDAPSACLWTAVSPVDWIRLTGDRQQRTGTAQFAYELLNQHDLIPRLGSLEAGGQTFPVLQKPVSMPQFFSDVALTHPFFDFINLAAIDRIIGACNGLQFCPDSPVTRAQMAEYVVRALYGTPLDYRQLPYFTDVNSLHPQFPYIQKLRDLGITSGCTATTFCADTVVTRGEASVFLVRARLGLRSPQAPPLHGPLPYFTDVPANHAFFGYIQKIRETGVTLGCSPTQFCPSNPLTKGQVAVLILRGLLAP